MTCPNFCYAEKAKKEVCVGQQLDKIGIHPTSTAVQIAF